MFIVVLLLYLFHVKVDVILCILCIFIHSSDAKYDSHCGWPSFTEAHGTKNGDESASHILRRPDNSIGMIRTEVICKNVSYLNIVKIKMQFYWNKWDFLMLHNNWYTVHHFCTGKKHKFLSSVGERFCKIKFYFFMFSISVMPI